MPTFVEGMVASETGDTVPAQKSFVDNSLSDSWSIRLIHITANVHSVAIGLKYNSDYSSFIAFSYNGDMNFVWKSAGVWYEKAL